QVQEGNIGKPWNSWRNHFQKLKLLVLLSYLLNKQLADAASLCYTYTVNISEWSHKVKGQLNEESFIICNRTNCRDINNLGKILSTTKSWQTLVDTLKDGIFLVIEQAHLQKQEIHTTREPLFLQVKKCCWYEANRQSYASCDLYLIGHKVLHLHPSTGKWNEVGPGSMRIKEMWEKNKDLKDFSFRTSQGDCKDWLNEKVSKLDLENKLEPTGLVKDTAGIFTSASPTIAPDVDPSSSMAMKPNAFVLLFALALLVLLKYLL
ncbi:UL16-binding protein 1, partial [Lemmus lemmus]